eukprot:8128275-Pyramimonas_sp.AAC.1
MGTSRKGASWPREGNARAPLEGSEDIQRIVGAEDASHEAQQLAAGRPPPSFRELGWAVAGSHIRRTTSWRGGPALSRS